MKELSESVKIVLSKLPAEYQDIAIRLKVNKDWQAVELVLALIRERMLETGKQTGDGRVFHALDGFDTVFKVLDKIAGTFATRAAVENRIFELKEKG